MRKTKEKGLEKLGVLPGFDPEGIRSSEDDDIILGMLLIDTRVRLSKANGSRKGGGMGPCPRPPPPKNHGDRTSTLLLFLPLAC